MVLAVATNTRGAVLFCWVRRQSAGLTEEPSWAESNAFTVSQLRKQLYSLVRPLRVEESDSASRLRMALEMMGAGLEMKRLSLQRAHPQETSEQIAERLSRWVQNQPVAPGLRHRPLS